MVKSLNLFRKLSKRDSKSGKQSKSPEIHVNSQPIDRNVFQSEDELYSKVDIFLNGSQSSSSETNSSFSDLILSNNSLNSVVECEILSKDKKIKNKLGEEGNRHIAELIAYLHSDKKSVKSKLDIDEQEYELLHSYDSAIDLDKFFEEKKSKVKQNLWKTPIYFSKKDDKKVMDQSTNGLHSVNRFGEGVSDGCAVSLSLSSKGRSFGDVFHKSLEWNDIIEEADQVLHQYEKFGNKSNRMARRGSLLQPRFIFLSPHPEVAYERVLQSANCLPLRAWTSELFLDSKESSELMDSETKRNLKWNASIEDFRHLLSPELSHFGNDVYSMLIQAKRRVSLCPPQASAQPVPFRRKSFQNEIWSPIDPNKHQKKDYDKKLGVIQKDSMKKEIKQKVLSYQSNDSLLTVPNEYEPKIFKRNRSDAQQIIEMVSIEELNPKIIANELTLIAKELLLSIRGKEVIVLLVRPQSVTPESCSSIMALLGFQKRVIQLITSYLLDQTDVETCAERMAYFIEVGKELKSLRNWHSMYSVVTSLQSPPIARLRQCWRIVSNEYSDTYCDFIEMSEQIKKEITPLDYTPPSIPLFDDLMDELKERCGSKLFEIKKHRVQSNWSKRDTVAVWVDQEIVDLVDSAKNKKKIQKRVEKIRKNSKELKIKKKSNKNRKDSESESTSSVTESRTGSIISWNSESKFRSKMSSSGGPTPSCKNIWSVTDFQKLRESDEKEILEEMARGLILYQRNATYYYLNGSDEKARNFLLFSTYQESEVCMKMSYGLEAPKVSKTSKLPQIVITD